MCFIRVIFAIDLYITKTRSVVPNKIRFATYACCYRDLFIGKQLTFTGHDYLCATALY